MHITIKISSPPVKNQSIVTLAQMMDDGMMHDGKKNRKKKTKREVQGMLNKL